MKLSNRLAAVAGFIGKDANVADIGTDHGHLPVYLVQSGPGRRIIASDKSAGSLQAARRSAAKYNVSDQITFVEAPGLEGVGETDVDTIAIAGLGGETISSILADAPWTKQPGIKLVLQPQTKISELCAWLHGNGYTVCDAASVRDRGRLYTIIVARATDAANET